MKTKHIFVAAVDVGDLLPFAIKQKESLQKDIKEQERAREQLVRFIEILEKQYQESIFYMGMDIIEAKSYERFIFENGGFFEIMSQVPLAMNAHFVDQNSAERFCSALKQTLNSILKDDRVSKMFIDSIEVQNEKDQSLTYERWNKMKDIK